MALDGTTNKPSSYNLIDSIATEVADRHTQNCNIIPKDWDFNCLMINLWCLCYLPGKVVNLERLRSRSPFPSHDHLWQYLLCRNDSRLPLHHSWLFSQIKLSYKYASLWGSNSSSAISTQELFVHIFNFCHWSSLIDVHSLITAPTNTGFFKSADIFPDNSSFPTSDTSK